jgi:hypothetical protein
LVRVKVMCRESLALGFGGQSFMGWLSGYRSNLRIRDSPVLHVRIVSRWELRMRLPVMRFESQDLIPKDVSLVAVSSE